MALSVTQRWERDSAILKTAKEAFAKKIQALEQREMKSWDKVRLLREGPLHLSRRQQEILELLKQGLENKEIAAKLFLSPYTVRQHVGKLLKRLKVDKRWKLYSRQGLR
jgi:DNA-binding NarL/FixJ family response regulator